MDTFIIALLVNNHFGVLTRVTGLFSRRGYNIATLSVGETADPETSRITIETRTDGPAARQIVRQLEKLEDVKTVALLPGGETVARELLLCKLVVTPARHDALLEAVKEFDCRVPYDVEGRVILEFAGSPAECEAFLERLSGHTILELCRTGTTAITTVLELLA
ncbi:MAG: acetolactate synthase small subunit [Oscillospiraceae bacterium]|jgi:acetolactate synthase-1/3 small subunit|nr:acetolactate synthase small subunit [Oscillospiraceae bacterium]